MSYVLLANILTYSFGKNSKISKFLFLAPEVNFGLDIVGGSQLLIWVDFDRFLEDKYQSSLDDLKQLLWDYRIRYSKIWIDRENNSIVVEKIKDDEENEKKVSKNIKKIVEAIDYNLNYSVRDNVISIEYDGNYIESLRSKVTEQSMLIIQKRIDNSGTKEIVMYRHGKDKIILQVPGVEDPDQLKRLLGKTAKLTFHLMDEREPFMSYMPSYTEEGMMVLPSAEGIGNRFYKVKKKPALNGDTLVDARYSVDNMRVSIVFRFNNQGTRKFAQITTDNVGKPFAIVLDDKVLTAPVINEPIVGGTGTISGHFSAEEAQELASLLKSGALPAHLSILEERIVGPSIGKEAIYSARFAFGIGIGLLMLFMLVYYRFLGLVANIAIILNLAFAVTVMAILKFSITLPGIAGLILTLGMSVDANVLIYERMRDEMKRKNVDIMTVVAQGFKGSFSAILDSNITTILSAITLVAIGSGFIRGFAISLIVGLLTSLFTAIVFTKMVVEFMAKYNKIRL